MKILEYNRKKAIEYAYKWAYNRNPNFYNFDKLGGDCTNFISQCIYSANNVMNYNKTNGWFYNSINNRVPSWTGVEFLHKFITKNEGIGPYGKEVNINEIELGDIVQLSFDGKIFSHSLIVTSILSDRNLNSILIATHTDDTYNRRLSTYTFAKIRFVKIEGIRIW